MSKVIEKKESKRESFQEISNIDLEVIDGGRKSTWDGLVTASSIAIGGIQTGIGLSTAFAGAITLNPLLIAGGSALLADGIYNIGTAY